MTIIFTIGYEGAAMADFLATLSRAGVRHVMDVRELPQSRRPGFSKKSLSQALSSVGIEYTHVRQLGDPKHGREAARRGNMEEFRSIFEAHMDLQASQESLEDAAKAVMQSPTVLMCYERDPMHCHRSLIVQRLLRLRSLQVTHLGVRSDVSRVAVSSGDGISRHT